MCEGRPAAKPQVFGCICFFPSGGDAGAAKSVSVLLRCEAPGLDGWRDSGLADNDIVAVVGAPIINIIAACFKAAPLLVVGKVVSLLVLDGEVKPQFALVFFKELDVEEFSLTFYAILEAN